MKSKLIISILILTMLLSGCVDNKNIDNKVTDKSQQDILKEQMSQSNTAQWTPTIPVTETVTSAPIQIENIKQNEKIEIEYIFGCIKFCSESRPSETDGMLTVKNIGNNKLNNLKLSIQYYTSSGKRYNTGISDGKNINPGEKVDLYIKVPSQYFGYETWTYAKLYIVENNTQYYLKDWNEDKNSEMPPINGLFIVEKLNKE